MIIKGSIFNWCFRWTRQIHFQVTSMKHAGYLFGLLLTWKLRKRWFTFSGLYSVTSQMAELFVCYVYLKIIKNANGVHISIATAKRCQLHYVSKYGNYTTKWNPQTNFNTKKDLVQSMCMVKTNPGAILSTQSTCNTGRLLLLIPPTWIHSRAKSVQTWQFLSENNGM